MTAFIRNALLIVATVLALSGCSDLQDRLNEKWPPLRLAQQQWIGIESAQSNLRQLNDVDAFFQVSSNLVALELTRKLKINVPELSNTRIKFANQAGLIETEFTLSLDDGVVLKGFATGGVSLQVKPDAIEMLPALETVNVTEIINPPWYVTDALVSSGNQALEQFLMRINSALAQKSENRIPLDLSLHKLFRMDHMLGNNLKKGELLGLGEASITLHVKRLVPSIQEEVLYIAIDLEPGTGQLQSETPSSAPEQLTAETVALKATEFEKAFSAKTAGLTLNPPSNAYLVVSNAFTSRVINEEFDSISLCGAYTFDGLPSKIKPTPIKPFENTPVLVCTPKRDCTFSYDKCSYDRDRRECNTCLIRNPFSGGCILRGNDLACEAAKGAKNVALELEAQACRRAIDIEKGTCEAAKSLIDKPGCEVNKEWLTRVRRIGDVGSIRGDLTLAGDAIACLNRLEFSPGLDSVEIDLGVGGQVKVSGEIRFIPNGAGHILACMAPWTRSVKTTLLVPNQTLSLKASMTFIEQEDGLLINVSSEKQIVQAHLDPSPVEALFDRNPDLKLICPGLGTLTVLEDIMAAVGKGATEPAFTGDYEHEIPAQTYVVELDNQTIEIGNTKLLGKVAINDKGVFYRLSEAQETTN